MKGQEYVRPMPATWFMHNVHLKLFMIRELTSVFVAGYAVLLIVLVARSNDAAAFAETLTCPAAVIFQIVALPFVVFHSITWFNVTPKAIVLFRGDERVNPLVIVGGHYALWAVASVVILVVALI
jgi:fumarate reductase subunit C